MTGTQDVDWAEVERRGRRLNAVALLALPTFFAAIVLLTGGYAFWTGSVAWVAVGVVVLYVVVIQALSVAVPRFRARTGPGLRIQYALQHHIDPGPELRGKTDRYARRMAGNRWFAWLFPALPLSFVLDGRWDRPLQAVPAAFVLVGFAVGVMLWWRRQAVAGARWVADMPGPVRELPPPSRWERMLTGRRVGWAIGVLLVVGFVLGLVGALLSRLAS
jgi:hypothetical protein